MSDISYYSNARPLETSAMTAKNDNGLSPEQALRKFSRTIRFRNAREWAACAFLVVAFGREAVNGKSPLHAISAVGVVAAALYIAWRLYRDGRPVATPDELADPARAARAHQRELRRQATLLDTVPRWYIAPFAVCWIGEHVADVLVRSASIGWFISLTSGIALGTWLALLNRRAGRTLRDQADRLGQATA